MLAKIRLAALFFSVCVAVGLSIAAGSGWAYLSLGIVSLVLGLRFLPVSIRVAVPVFLLLVVPADSIVAWPTLGKGYLVFGFTVALLLSTLTVGGLRGYKRADLDFHLFVAYLTAITLLHHSSGELRTILYWVSAAGVLVWARRVPISDRELRTQTATGIIAAGTISSASAIVASVTSFDPVSLLPGYEFVESLQTGDFASRATGLSGHPLRLGTLAMLAVVLAAARSMGSEHRSRDMFILLGTVLVNSLALVLSGSRGSWLSLLIAMATLVVLRQPTGTRGYRLRLAGGAAAAVVVVWASGLTTYVQERLVGSASAPASIRQRREALEAVMEIWSQLPLFGGGPASVANLAPRIGLRNPAIENEYVITMISCGVVGLGVLLFCIVRRFVESLRAVDQNSVRAPLSALVAIAVNIATFNTFSWSAGPSLFALILAGCSGFPSLSGRLPPFEASGPRRTPSGGPDS